MSEPPKKRKFCGRVKRACTNCKKAKRCCENERPCSRCVRLGLENCRDAERKDRSDKIRDDERIPSPIQMLPRRSKRARKRRESSPQMKRFLSDEEPDASSDSSFSPHEATKPESNKWQSGDSLFSASPPRSDIYIPHDSLFSSTPPLISINPRSEKDLLPSAILRQRRVASQQGLGHSSDFGMSNHPNLQSPVESLFAKSPSSDQSAKHSAPSSRGTWKDTALQRSSTPHRTPSWTSESSINSPDLYAPSDAPASPNLTTWESFIPSPDASIEILTLGGSLLPYSYP
jgi:hypothetical protein